MVIQAESSENVDTTSLIGDKWTGWTLLKNVNISEFTIFWKHLGLCNYTKIYNTVQVFFGYFNFNLPYVAKNYESQKW